MNVFDDIIKLLKGNFKNSPPSDLPSAARLIKGSKTTVRNNFIVLFSVDPEEIVPLTDHLRVYICDVYLFTQNLLTHGMI